MYNCGTLDNILDLNSVKVETLVGGKLEKVEYFNPQHAAAHVAGIAYRKLVNGKKSAFAPSTTPNWGA